MMDQSRWDKLKEVFDNEELFWESNCIEEGEAGIDLFDWLDCDSRSPSGAMKKEFLDHGYVVKKVEGDSFGWLIGCVQELKTGKEIIFG